MNEAVSPATIVTWGGFVLAFIFGAVANKTNFCTMGAISDVVNMDHWGRMRMWLLTIAVAIIGTNLLFYFGLIDLSKSVYQRPTITWLSMLLGGFLFGIGMTISAGCVNKNLVRLGGGSMRSLVVLVFMAISAYMTLKGLFGQWRASFLDPVAIDLASFGLATQGLPLDAGEVGWIAGKDGSAGAPWQRSVCACCFLSSRTSAFGTIIPTSLARSPLAC